MLLVCNKHNAGLVKCLAVFHFQNNIQPDSFSQQPSGRLFAFLLLRLRRVRPVWASIKLCYCASKWERFPRVYLSGSSYNYINTPRDDDSGFISAISNPCLTFPHSHCSKSKWITVMKVNKWNQIKQGHTSLEGQQMGTEMEIIFFPLCLNKNGGKKAISSGQTASCHFAYSAAATSWTKKKNIGLLRGSLYDSRGSLILMEKDSSFVK